MAVDLPPAGRAYAVENIADFVDAVENLMIAIGMGWDLDGTADIVRSHLAKIIPEVSGEE